MRKWAGVHLSQVERQNSKSRFETKPARATRKQQINEEN